MKNLTEKKIDKAACSHIAIVILYKDFFESTIVSKRRFPLYSKDPIKITLWDYWLALLKFPSQVFSSSEGFLKIGRFDLKQIEEVSKHGFVTHLLIPCGVCSTSPFQREQAKHLLSRCIRQKTKDFRISSSES